MAEDRPYRMGLNAGEILEVLATDVPHRLDATCFAALQLLVPRWKGASMPGRSALATPARRPPRRARPVPKPHILAAAS